MGGVFSWGRGSRTRDYIENSHNASSKKQKLSPCCHEDGPRLIPSLPDELSILILARVPRYFYLNMRLVSRKWNATAMSPELFEVRKELGKTEEWLYILTKVENDKFLWHALDPLSRQWQRLPPLPQIVHEEEPRKSSSGLWNMVGSGTKIAEAVRGWLGWTGTLPQVPFCGCAIAAVDGCLYMLGGFSKNSTMSCVWRYDPIVNSWSEATSMTVGRAYCKTGILNNKLYVVGGVIRGRGGLSPLPSAEVFDPYTGKWSEVPSMPFSRAQELPNAFFADMLKPIATGMTSYMGRLCVPQSLYSWPFFVDVGGEIYNPNTNSWVEMPIGMGEGWPARQAGTKLSAVVDGELYAFDPSSSLDSGKIKVYDQKEDAWKVVIEEVPVHDFADSESPYLLIGFHGKLHVLTKDANRNISLLRADPHDNLGSVSSSTVSLSADYVPEHSTSQPESDTGVWKAVATRNFGSAELVNCQVLDI